MTILNKPKAKQRAKHTEEYKEEEKLADKERKKKKLQKMKEDHNTTKQGTTSKIQPKVNANLLKC